MTEKSIYIPLQKKSNFSFQIGIILKSQFYQLSNSPKSKGKQIIFILSPLYNTDYILETYSIEQTKKTFPASLAPTWTQPLYDTSVCPAILDSIQYSKFFYLLSLVTCYFQEFLTSLPLPSKVCFPPKYSWNVKYSGNISVPSHKKKKKKKK